MVKKIPYNRRVNRSPNANRLSVFLVNREWVMQKSSRRARGLAPIIRHPLDIGPDSAAMKLLICNRRLYSSDPKIIK